MARSEALARVVIGDPGDGSRSLDFVGHPVIEREAKDALDLVGKWGRVAPRRLGNAIAVTEPESQN